MFIDNVVSDELQKTLKFEPQFFSCSSTQQKIAASVFQPFYAQLAERSQLTNQPLEVLERMGTPTYRKLMVLDFPSWSQQVHGLFPDHLSKYHLRTAFGFVAGAPISSIEDEDLVSLKFEMKRWWFLPGHNIHNILGPYCFAVGNPAAPELWFAIVPLDEKRHILEISIYSRNASRAMQIYYRVAHNFFNLVAQESVREDLKLYQRYSDRDRAYRFLIAKARDCDDKQKGYVSATATMQNMFQKRFGDRLEQIEKTARKITVPLVEYFDNKTDL